MSSNFIAWLTHPDNPARSATLATTSAASGYPSTNLQALPVSSTWRSTNLATQDITIDFGSARAVDLLALVNHNLTSAATITIAAGTTSGVSDFSVAMSYRQFIAFKWIDGGQTYRYWRIRIADAANPDNFMEVGYVVVGNSTKPNFTMRQGWTSGPEFVNSEVYSEFGTPHVEEMFRRQVLEMSFGPIRAADMPTLTTLYTTLMKNVYPVLLLPVRGGTDAFFVRFSNNLNIKYESSFQFAEATFMEDSFGASIEA